ncbi:MAG: hypothetical protein PW789_05695 [Edaphobacter sp.]|uniref:hypothetical protein n=1 Tax=Edaphobacter sp. TaxID=1934404 RepID=UPI00238A8B12|nr:hypothetical protein [Edaphobacter sp.]MDE1176084.1 hypothetical protein [Edaphobacter sp.]
MQRASRYFGWIGQPIAVASLGLALVAPMTAETCTTQSAMAAADRDAMAAAAQGLAQKVIANDADGLRAMTIAEFSRDFGGIQNLVAATSGKLKGAAPVVEQIYVLDASDLKKNPDGSNGNAQFFCSLNKSPAEVDFSIPGLPPAKYGFAIVEAQGVPTPWRLAFLMEEVNGKWQMAGFYPRPLTAAGHDGLWYWTEARTLVKNRQPWSAWLYYQQAESLLNPANMIQSTHLEKLRNEQSTAAPPALSSGISSGTPLVVKGTDGAEYHFTSLGVDDSLAKEKVDVTAHLKVDQLGDPVAARKRNVDAMTALVAAYPDLRKNFHGVWIFSEVPGQSPYATELAMSEIR